MSSFALLAQYYPWLPLVMLTLLGLLVGSFLNVVIHRLPLMLERSWKQEFDDYFSAPQTVEPLTQLPEKYNLVVPRSACPHCGHAISAWENIPLISWLCLKGRCKACHAPISARYPLVELLTGILSAVLVWQYPLDASLAAALVLTWTLVALTFIDFDRMLLPDQLTLPLLWLGLLLNTRHLFVSLEDAVIGAAAGYLVLWCLYWTFKLLTGKEGMGYGDFKLLAALGAWLGWQALPLILILSSFIGALIGISLILLHRHTQGKPIPFGPYLAIAGWIALIWGDKITHWYLGMVL